MPTEKICASCGRPIEWRRRWARCWDSVRYCSERCRRTRSERRGAPLEKTILDLLGARPRGASICPSEAARAADGEDWRSLMEPVREAARRLAARRVVEITQGGRVVDPGRFRGPIRIRLAGAAPSRSS